MKMLRMHHGVTILREAGAELGKQGGSRRDI